jgi:integrase/recombinase XerD
VGEVSIAVKEPLAPHRTDEDLLQEFLADCGLRGMTPESIYGYGSCIRIFLHFLERHGRSLLTVDKDVLRSFLSYLRDERRVSLKRVENYFSALSSLYEYLAYEGYVASNPVLPVRKRYLRTYKKGGGSGQRRKLISVEEMSGLINSVFSVRDRAMITLLAKTGIRRGELIRIDLDDIDWEEMSITLKPRAKRSNRVVFFDSETVAVLKDWLRLREGMEVKTKALFVGDNGGRLKRSGVYNAVVRWAKRAGLHDPSSARMEDHFTPHCCRHWFTTHLRRAGMPREFIQELRGDKRRDAIDIYDHIDRAELRKAYLAYIPRLFIA